MLLHRKGKLTIAKSKSSRLSYIEVVSLPLESIFSKIYRYEAELSDSVVSFISSSSGTPQNLTNVLYFKFIGPREDPG
jgi:hypothetical protein